MLELLAAVLGPLAAPVLGLLTLLIELLASLVLSTRPLVAASLVAPELILAAVLLRAAGLTPMGLLSLMLALLAELGSLARVLLTSLGAVRPAVL